MTEPSEYDWASFITAYALGRWEPHKAPPPPRSNFERQHQPHSLTGSPPEVSSDPHISSSIPPSGSAGIASNVLSTGTPRGVPVPHASSDALAPSKADTPPQTTSPPSTVSSTPTHSSSGFSSLVWVPSTSRRNSAANMALSIPHRLRNSFADIRSSIEPRPVLDPTPTSTAAPAVLHANATTAAAAMRWAGARINIAPLALPSPEHELTDPFRNARTVIPGLNPPDIPLGPQSPRHRQRLGSFWEGTIDVERTTVVPPALSSIQGSPPSTPPTADSSDTDTEPLSGSAVGPSPPYATPASVPLRPSTGNDDDYFGIPALSTSPESRVTVLSRQHLSSEPEVVQTAPVDSRHINLTRQTSSPLPNRATGPPVGLPSPTRGVDAGAGRALKEETTFLELGYLTPPYPPDEFERRRALYQFNIWNTGPDINFERIEHLTKLVFSTKTVIISLIDGNEQYVSAARGFEGITNRPPRWIKSACKYHCRQSRGGCN
jgi:hypothetical protein